MPYCIYAMHTDRRIHKRVLRWGDSFGIRLTRADLERLDVHVDDEVDVNIDPSRREIDWGSLPRLHLARDASTRHDEIIAQGIGDQE